MWLRKAAQPSLLGHDGSGRNEARRSSPKVWETLQITSERNWCNDPR